MVSYLLKHVLHVLILFVSDCRFSRVLWAYVILFWLIILMMWLLFVMMFVVVRLEMMVVSFWC